MSAPEPARLRVVVVGSANHDYIARVQRLPNVGETVLAHDIIKQPGGKGANQAVAAARMRGDVSMVASVGDDADGMELIRGLRCEGVDTSRVQIMSRASTGLALICVQASGENSIVVVPGTNFLLASAHVRESIHGLLAVGEGGIVVLQAEIEPNVIAEAVRIAHDAGARIVLNLAPFRKLDDDVIVNSDPLVLNENEASQCVGFVVDSVASAQAALAELRPRVRSAVVTIGALGACWQDGERGGYVPATRVEGVVDTTGAGDAFVGALTAELARGQGLEQAVRVGVAAGTFAVQRLGAQSSYPTPSDLGYT